MLQQNVYSLTKYNFNSCSFHKEFKQKLADSLLICLLLLFCVCQVSVVGTLGLVAVVVSYDEKETVF